MNYLTLTFFDAWTVSGIIASLPVIFLLYCYLFLAEKDIFFTFGRQNCVMYVMSDNGKVWTGKIIFPSNSFDVDMSTYNVEYHTTPENKRKISQPIRIFGMYWVGIPPFRKIYKYELSWQDVTPKGEDYNFTPRNEMTPYLFVQRTPYGMFLKEAENIDGYPLNIKFIVFLRATNVKKPIFDNADAFAQLQAMLLGEAAIYVKASTFASLYDATKAKVTSTDEIKKEHDGFSSFLCKLNDYISGETNGGVKEKLGFEIMGAKIITVDLAGEESKKIIEATIQVALAQKNKEATIITAEGEGKSMDIITAAKEKRYKIFKDNKEATEIEVAEKTFENSNLTTYVAGGNTNAMPTVKVN